MTTSSINILTSQIKSLSQEWPQPFPYADCRKVLSDLAQMEAGKMRRASDFIPDLNTYFYNVYSYSHGVTELMHWPADKLLKAHETLKRSFFQQYARYKPAEWMINQINTPQLYQEMALSDQLRHLLLALISQRLLELQQANAERQERFLLQA